MNILQKAYAWFDRTFSLTDPLSGRAFTTGDSYVSKTVTEHSAMQVSVVWACVRLLSETVGSLPLAIYGQTESGKSEKLEEDPLTILLHESPNADMTGVEFIEANMMNLVLLGMAYSLIDRNGKRVNSLYPMPTSQVVPERTERGSIVYRFSDRGKVETYPAEKIFVLKGFGSNGLIGLSPLAYARHAMELSMVTEEFGSRFFSQGAGIGGVLTFPVWLKEDQRKLAEDKFQNLHVGLHNSHKALILEGGVTYTPNSIPPEDAQFLQTRQFQLPEICRFFGVPPHMVADLTRSTNNNIEQQALEFVKYTLRPYLTRWEQAIKRRLFTPEERTTKYARFNLDGLLRADSATRAAFMSTMVQNGIYTRNECRRLENMDDMEGADGLTVQVNLAPLDQLGKALNPQPAEAMS